MRIRGAYWTHKKYSGKFQGSYVRLYGERVFELVGAKRFITFESWQAAKSMGWRKV